MRRENKIFLFLIILIIIFNERFLYLIKFTNTIFVSIEVILVIVMFCWHIRAIIDYKRFELKVPILIMFFLIIITALITILYANQPIRDITKAYRHMLLYLLYFPLIICLESEKNYNYIKNILMAFGAIFSILAILEILTGGTGHILKGASYGFRFDEVRFYSGFSLVVPSLFICISNILDSKRLKNRLFNFCIVIIELYYFFYVTKTRNLIAAIIISIIIIIIIQKRYKSIFKIGVVIFVLGVMLFLFKDILFKLSDSMFNDTANVVSRIDTINYIMDNIKSSLFLGLGMYAPEFTGVPLQVQVDVGVFGYFFEFGIVGLLLLMYILLKIIKKMWYLYKKSAKDIYLFIGYMSYSIIILPFNCMLNYQEIIIYFLIIYSLLEIKYRKVRNLEYM